MNPSAVSASGITRSQPLSFPILLPAVKVQNSKPLFRAGRGALPHLPPRPHRGDKLQASFHDLKVELPFQAIGYAISSTWEDVKDVATRMIQVTVLTVAVLVGLFGGQKAMASTLRPLSSAPPVAVITQSVNDSVSQPFADSKVLMTSLIAAACLGMLVHAANVREESFTSSASSNTSLVPTRFLPSLSMTPTVNIPISAKLRMLSAAAARLDATNQVNSVPMTSAPELASVATISFAPTSRQLPAVVTPASRQLPAAVAPASRQLPVAATAAAAAASIASISSPSMSLVSIATPALDTIHAVTLVSSANTTAPVRNIPIPDVVAAAPLVSEQMVSEPVSAGFDAEAVAMAVVTAPSMEFEISPVQAFTNAVVDMQVVQVGPLAVAEEQQAVAFAAVDVAEEQVQAVAFADMSVVAVAEEQVQAVAFVDVTADLEQMAVAIASAPTVIEQQQAVAAPIITSATTANRPTTATPSALSSTLKQVKNPLVFALAVGFATAEKLAPVAQFTVNEFVIPAVRDVVVPALKTTVNFAVNDVLPVASRTVAAGVDEVKAKTVTYLESRQAAAKRAVPPPLSPKIQALRAKQAAEARKAAAPVGFAAVLGVFGERVAQYVASRQAAAKRVSVPTQGGKQRGANVQAVTKRKRRA